MTATTTTPNKSIEELEKHAEAIRAQLRVPRQSDVFRCAIEAGYLTALADGEVDAVERETLAKAVEILSVGAVLDWEVEALIEQIQARVDQEGAEKRCASVGNELKTLGQAEPGLFIAAIVARATRKIDKSEADVLKAVGKAAGLTNDQVAAIVKRSTAL